MLSGLDNRRPGSALSSAVHWTHIFCLSGKVPFPLWGFFSLKLSGLSGSSLCCLIETFCDSVSYCHALRVILSAPVPHLPVSVGQLLSSNTFLTALYLWEKHLLALFSLPSSLCIYTITMCINQGLVKDRKNMSDFKQCLYQIIRCSKGRGTEVRKPLLDCYFQSHATKAATQGSETCAAATPSPITIRLGSGT